MKTGNDKKNARREPDETPEDSDMAMAIARLPATVRWLVILGERDGLTPSEIATLVGVSLELVKVMQSRGLTLIQEDPLIGCGADS